LRVSSTTTVKNMKYYFLTFVITSALTISIVIASQKSHAENTVNAGAMISGAAALKNTNQLISAAFVTEIPPGYRDWRLISVAHEEGNVNDIRAILGNDIAITAYRERKLPFPDGAIIARVAWRYVSSKEDNEIFGQAQSFVAGPPTNGLEFMVKDSKKYSATGGWGFGHFGNDGKPADESMMLRCFTCHQAIKARDFVFARYAP
jgi:hypothetical protein